MKRIKYYIFLLLGMASMASCDNALTDDVQMGIGVELQDGVTMQGDVVTVKKGTPVVFNFTGEPDNITFYSGEDGSVYAYKDRTQVSPDDIESSTLHFEMWNQYGTPSLYQNPMHILCSTSWEGLNKANFKADSVAVENFAWDELVPEDDMPKTILNAANKAVHYDIDMTSYLGKNFTLALHYQGKTKETNQSKFYFVNMYISNKLKSGKETKLYAGNFGFTAVNMLCHLNLSDQRTMTANREYGTVTNNTSGIWNLASAASGSFFIHSSAKNTELKNSWLVSNPIIINSCSPDQGQAVKNIAQSINTYAYTYNTVGEYKATFIATNSNYKHESRLIKEITVKVVE